MNLNDNVISHHCLDPNVARNLSNHTITAPMMETITPRWLLTFLPWVSVEAGIYRLNHLKRIKTWDMIWLKTLSKYQGSVWGV